jgi:hypothetical protein
MHCRGAGTGGRKRVRLPEGLRDTPALRALRAAEAREGAARARAARQAARAVPATFRGGSIVKDGVAN